MEDNKLKKLNIPACDLPEVPRKEDNTIDLEAITIEIDEKGNRIIPDEIFNAYYQELPDKVINQSKSWRTAKGGKLKILGGDPEGDKAIHEAGGKALQATLEQRRSIKEILEQLSRKAADPEDIERLGLEEGTTTLEAANYAAIQRAIRGDIKALEYIRDTLGEKPVDKIAAEVETITAEDRERIERILNRDKTAD
jgi:hypothetical protein